MQIVIDIDDSKLWEIKNEPIKKNFNIYELANYIDKGIPLPKGHGRLIDADATALLSDLCFYTIYTGIDKAPHVDARRELAFAPTIIEADKEN